MIIKVRCARDVRDGIEATYVMIDPWEAELFKAGHPDFPRGPLEPGTWYGVAVPAAIMAVAKPVQAPAGQPDTVENGRVISYLRRDIDLERLRRWEQGQQFQAKDLHHDVSA